MCHTVPGNDTPVPAETSDGNDEDEECGLMWSQQVVSVEGRTLQCELRSEDHSRQAEVFREARTSFSRYQNLTCPTPQCNIPMNINRRSFKYLITLYQRDVFVLLNCSSLSSELPPPPPVCLSAIRTLELRTKTCLRGRPRAPTPPLSRSVVAQVSC